MNYHLWESNLRPIRSPRRSLISQVRNDVQLMLQDDVEVTTLTRTVFKRTWTEFYSKEVQYSQRCIDSLARPTTSAPAFPVSKALISDAFENWDSGLSLGSETPPESHLYATCIELDPETPFAPHPSYESCTPCVQSIYLGDDPEEMPFIPFADDPDYDYIENTLFYDRFAWQFRDQPDAQRTRLLVDPDREATFSYPDLAF